MKAINMKLWFFLIYFCLERVALEKMIPLCSAPGTQRTTCATGAGSTLLTSHKLSFSEQTALLCFESNFQQWQESPSKEHCRNHISLWSMKRIFAETVQRHQGKFCNCTGENNVGKNGETFLSPLKQRDKIKSQYCCRLFSIEAAWMQSEQSSWDLIW